MYIIPMIPVQFLNVQSITAEKIQNYENWVLTEKKTDLSA